MDENHLDSIARVDRRLLKALAAIAFIIVAGIIWSEARAHEAPSGWSYPVQCCSNRDCAEIPASRVKESPQGYRVTLVPGDHDFVKAQTSWLIPYEKTKPSPDGVYHICISPTMTMLCFFAGARSF
jgi:hypothetical protein